jgi:ubiquinone/menaquinone biosynthesis C-methylase UbiE
MADANQQTASPRDEKALEIFQQQWDIYRKFLEHDYLGNAGAYAHLRAFLKSDIPRPFALLDLACGDASGIVKAVQGLGVTSYRGVDLSGPALDIARTNLHELPCAAELVQADFVAAMRTLRSPADIVWISLSLHHLDTAAKRTLMREVRQGLGEGGAFLIYEPTSNDGESRAAYLDRFEDIGRRDWTALSAHEFAEAMNHVRTCDLPETISNWLHLGHEAGFTAVSELYRSPDNLFRLFSYRA